ncbi:hypothetical protein B0H14DRAFT_3481530 [Mycena olivaceomarginata]|nr:hypothetical protein B0H14DRAFT_3481530 [Mycena olivaceomarginata]
MEMTSAPRLDEDERRGDGSDASVFPRHLHSCRQYIRPPDRSPSRHQIHICCGPAHPSQNKNNNQTCETDLVHPPAFSSFKPRMIAHMAHSTRSPSSKHTPSVEVMDVKSAVTHLVPVRTDEAADGGGVTLTLATTDLAYLDVGVVVPLTLLALLLPGDGGTATARVGTGGFFAAAIVSEGGVLPFPLVLAHRWCWLIVTVNFSRLDFARRSLEPVDISPNRQFGHL